MKIVSSLIVIIIVLNIGCSSDGIKEEVKNTKTYLILFDMSGSSQKSEIREAYSSGFKKVIEKIEPRDNLMIAFITEKSLNQIDLLINYEFPVFTPTNDNELYAAPEKQHFNKLITGVKDSITKVVDSILINCDKKINNTDILSSLVLAQQVFGTFTKTDKILIIFSDMEEDSKNYCFTKETMNENKITSIIKNQRKSNLIPDLSGVKVYCFGAKSVTPEKYKQIQNFWFKYFTECKAELNKENYNTVLVRFN